MAILTELSRQERIKTAGEVIAGQFVKTRWRRRVADNLAGYVLFFCALIVLAPLFSILFELVVHGITALNWDFFTQLPKPVGESGGGMANAIAGTLILLGIALLV